MKTKERIDMIENRLIILKRQLDEINRFVDALKLVVRRFDKYKQEKWT